MKKTYLFLLFLLIFSSFFSVVSANSFGYDQIGVSEVAIKNVFRGSQCYLSENGVVYSVTIALKSASGLLCNFRIGLFDSSFNLVEETYQQNVTLTSTMTWYSYNLMSNVSLLAGVYYVELWGNSSGAEPTICYNVGTTNSATYNGLTFGGYSFPNTFVPETRADRFYSAYVNYYVPDVEPTASPVPTSVPISEGELSNAMLFVLGFMVVLCVVGLVWLSRVPVVVLLIGLFAVLVGLYCVLGGVYGLGVGQGWFALFTVVFGGLTMLLVGLGVRVRR